MSIYVLVNLVYIVAAVLFIWVKDAYLAAYSEKGESDLGNRHVSRRGDDSSE